MSGLILPSDLEKWPKIRKALLRLKFITDLTEWTEYLEAVLYTYMHGPYSESSRYLFHDLSEYLDACEPAEKWRVLHYSLPNVVDLVLGLEGRRRDYDVIYTEGVSSLSLMKGNLPPLLACAFLQLYSCDTVLAFNHFFRHLLRTDVSIGAKLRWLVEYFDRAQVPSPDCGATVTYTRQPLAHSGHTTLSRLSSCRRALCTSTVTSDLQPQTTDRAKYMFQNKRTRSQQIYVVSTLEESGHLSSPELLVTYLLLPNLKHDETAIVTGLHIQSAGDEVYRLDADSCCDLGVLVARACCVLLVSGYAPRELRSDSSDEYYSASESLEDDGSEHNDSLDVFSGPCDEVVEPGSSPDRRYDLARRRSSGPLLRALPVQPRRRGSNPEGCDLLQLRRKLSNPLENELKRSNEIADLRRGDYDVYRRRGSGNGDAVFRRRGFSEAGRPGYSLSDVNGLNGLSAQHAARSLSVDGEGRRRGGSLSDQDVRYENNRRRGSGYSDLSRRSSSRSSDFSGVDLDRRRSSNLSELSSRRSSSSTRYSSDFSSEFEEYYESFQKQEHNHIWKTAIVEEESHHALHDFATNLVSDLLCSGKEEAVSSQPVYSFYTAQPSSALRPEPVRPHRPHLPPLKPDFPDPGDSPLPSSASCFAPIEISLNSSPRSTTPIFVTSLLSDVLPSLPARFSPSRDLTSIPTSSFGAPTSYMTSPHIMTSSTPSYTTSLPIVTSSPPSYLTSPRIVTSSPRIVTTVVTPLPSTSVLDPPAAFVVPASTSRLKSATSTTTSFSGPPSFSRDYGGFLSPTVRSTPAASSTEAHVRPFVEKMFLKSPFTSTKKSPTLTKTKQHNGHMWRHQHRPSAREKLLKYVDNLVKKAVKEALETFDNGAMDQITNVAGSMVDGVFDELRDELKQSIPDSVKLSQRTSFEAPTIVISDTISPHINDFACRFSFDVVSESTSDVINIVSQLDGEPHFRLRKFVERFVDNAFVEASGVIVRKYARPRLDRLKTSPGRTRSRSPRSPYRRPANPSPGTAALTPAYPGTSPPSRPTSTPGTRRSWHSPDRHDQPTRRVHSSLDTARPRIPKSQSFSQSENVMDDVKTMRRHKSLSGFQDPDLSRFAVELNRSNFTSPQLEIGGQKISPSSSSPSSRISIRTSSDSWSSGSSQTSSGSPCWDENGRKINKKQTSWHPSVLELDRRKTRRLERSKARFDHSYASLCRYAERLAEQVMCQAVCRVCDGSEDWSVDTSECSVAVSDSSSGDGDARFPATTVSVQEAWGPRQQWQDYVERLVETAMKDAMQALHVRRTKVCDDEELSLMAHWLAASYHNVPHLHFLLPPGVSVSQVETVVSRVTDRGLSVGDLTSLLVQYCDQHSDIPLFPYILNKLA